MTEPKPVSAIPDGTLIRRMRPGTIPEPQQALNASERRQHVAAKALETMPINTTTDDVVEIHFIPTKEIISPSNLDSHLEELGYRLVDPLVLLAFNRVDQDFADRFPNGTQWKHSDGNFYCLAFDRDQRDKQRRVVVDQIINSWSAAWYHGCVRI